MSDRSAPRRLPVLPLKNTVLFPHQMLPLVVGRPSSMAAVEAALSTEDKTLVVVSQQDDELEEPRFQDLFTIGTLAVIKKMARADHVIQIVVQGIERVTLVPDDQQHAFLQALIEPLPSPDDWDTETEALHREVLDLARRILERVNPQAQAALNQMIEQVDTPLQQVYVLSSLLSLKREDEQRLLAADRQAEALRLVHDFLAHEVQVLEVRQKIADQAQSEMSREQREYLLRKQLRAIQEELGDKSPEQADVEELQRQLDAAQLPEEPRKEADRELKRLERLPAAAPDYQVTRSYLELLAELPWNKWTEDHIDLQRAQEILDRDHFGLPKVKQRILEYLAVMKLNPHARAPILCFVGPPGVGKTSLGHSIAEAIGRKFAAKVWAGSPTRPSCVAIDELTSARCPAGSSRPSAVRVSVTRC